MTRRPLDITPKRGTNPDGSKSERRKSSRFAVNVPVEVSWRGPDGMVQQTGVARQVNAQGGMIAMPSYPEVGSRVTVVNLLSAETAEARVLATPSSRKGVAEGIVVELTTPSEQFWGVSLLSKKAGIELQKLENSLRSSGVDLRLLNEFRDAVDYLRLLTSAVQELRERQLQEREEEEILALLVVERIRRGIGICNELIVDLDGGKVTAETKGIDELARVLNETDARVRSIVRRREPERAPAPRKQGSFARADRK